MTHLRNTLIGVALVAVPFLFAKTAQADGVQWSTLPQIKQITQADIVVFGEVHDNAQHHDRQASLLRYNAQLEGAARDAPSHFGATAVVYEMLTAQQAKAVTPKLVEDETALEAALGWNDSGWPDFAMYYPIFAARPDLPVYGAAVPRNLAREAMSEGIISDRIKETLGREVWAYGLFRNLSEQQQEARNTLQLDAHCGALPEDLLPKMVAIQRLRDARLAQVAVQAFDAHGGPVLVITGNGHARKDWGMPYAVNFARPEVSVFVIQQGEDGSTPPGGADLVLDAPAPERGDPCAAFKK